MVSADSQSPNKWASAKGIADISLPTFSPGLPSLSLGQSSPFGAGAAPSSPPDGTSPRDSSPFPAIPAGQSAAAGGRGEARHKRRRSSIPDPSSGLPPSSPPEGALTGDLPPSSPPEYDLGFDIESGDLDEVEDDEADVRRRGRQVDGSDDDDEDEEGEDLFGDGLME